MPSVVGLSSSRQCRKIVGVCLGDEAINTKLLIVVLGIIVFVDLSFFFEESIETSSPSFSWSALMIAKGQSTIQS